MSCDSYIVKFFSESIAVYFNVRYNKCPTVTISSDTVFTAIFNHQYRVEIANPMGLGTPIPSVGLYWNHRLEENMIDEIKEQADLKGLYPEYQDEELHVYNNLEIGELEKGEQAVKTLVDKLVEIRDFTNGLETLREALGN